MIGINEILQGTMDVRQRRTVDTRCYISIQFIGRTRSCSNDDAIGSDQDIFTNIAAHAGMFSFRCVRTARKLSVDEGIGNDTKAAAGRDSAVATKNCSRVTSPPIVTDWRQVGITDLSNGGYVYGPWRYAKNFITYTRPC